LGALFAGVLNTTNIACWIPLFLDANPEWKAKVAVEIKSLFGNDDNENEPVAARLLQIPPSAWEENLPVIDAVIRETIRLIVTGVAMRRNVNKDVVIDGKVVEKGAFLIYPLNEIHFDPEIYSDPYSFDPGRFDQGREEDRKVHFGFLGWGVGQSQFQCLIDG
jgi:cytochrome P450